MTVLERTNARALTPETLPYAPDLVVDDVSFISLAKVLPAVLACLAPRYDVLAMIKPQFEVGRGNVGKGGVVRDARRTPRRARRGRGGRACGWARRCSASRPRACRGRRATSRASSGSPRAGATATSRDIEAAARVVEP